MCYEAFYDRPTLICMTLHNLVTLLKKSKKTFKASEPIILWYFKVQIGIVELRTCGTLSYSTWKGPQNTCTHNKMLFCADRYIVDIIFIKNTYTNLLKTFYLYSNVFLVCWTLWIFCMVGSILENAIFIFFYRYHYYI